mgnify:CR=1 FL=1
MTAMTRIIKLFLLSVTMITCITDYSVITNEQVTVEYDRDTQEQQTQLASISYVVISRF